MLRLGWYAIRIWLVAVPALIRCAGVGSGFGLSPIQGETNCKDLYITSQEYIFEISDLTMIKSLFWNGDVEEKLI
jgi:hypothetical protein